MARTQANSTGPAPLTATNSILAQLENEINRSFRLFHDHSKICRGCRHPLESYRKQRDLCEDGRSLCINITKLLYKKAEHVPEGTFTVEFKQGWEAVDELIRIIAHYNQGLATNEIVDIKRLQPRHRMTEVDPRGSNFEADMNRRQQAGDRYRRSPQHTATTLAVYGDPRTSFLDATTGRTQADISPASSNRSVHFASTVHVREFEKDT